LNQGLAGSLHSEYDLLCDCGFFHEAVIDAINNLYRIDFECCKDNRMTREEAISILEKLNSIKVSTV
jgi:hypothetical protein